MSLTTFDIEPTTLIPASELFEHWQGHRRLTRKMIDAFPEDKLFTFSIGGMRPFSALVMEFLGMAEPGIVGIQTGVWKRMEELPHRQRESWPETKQGLLDHWDAVTEKLNTLWPLVPVSRLSEIDIAYGQWKGPVYSFIQYWVDNEIHHRGQAYVYLRALGIEPPAFWDRS